MSSSSSICLMARATSSKFWLLHQRLSHLSFDTINKLAKDNIVTCLPNFKYSKDHLCPSCEQRKSKKKSHSAKPILILRIGSACSSEIAEDFDSLSFHHGFAAALAVLVTGASQSRQHESHHRFFPVDTSLIHIESRKSPTKSLFDVGSRRISIFTVNTKEYHSDVLAIITRIMRRT
ncbi:retrovirus-related pol polyprotein from transposon TNT 1-94 [Tanacetum coccineum]